MNKTIKFSVKKIDNFKRVDIFLSEKIKEYTRSFLTKQIKKSNLSINNKIVCSPSSKIKTSDQISFQIDIKKDNKLTPKNIKINVVFEDKDILVLDKPKGMVVHPGAGNFENTLANALVHKYKKNLSNLNGQLRPGIVHRIDKNTSGLLVVAKNNLAHSKLGKQFSNHSIRRKYICLVWGVIRPLNGRIETLISRSKKNRQLMSVSEIRGKKAITNYKTLKVFVLKNIPKISLLECELETGRTHQIRVHINHKGSSLLGDKQYGKKNLKFKNSNKNFLEALENLDGQALHAQTLEFVHPTRNCLVKFKSKIPGNLMKILNILEDLTS